MNQRPKSDNFVEYTYPLEHMQIQPVLQEPSMYRALDYPRVFEGVDIESRPL